MQAITQTLVDLASTPSRPARREAVSAVSEHAPHRPSDRATPKQTFANALGHATASSEQQHADQPAAAQPPKSAQGTEVTSAPADDSNSSDATIDQSQLPEKSQEQAAPQHVEVPPDQVLPPTLIINHDIEAPTIAAEPEAADLNNKTTTPREREISAVSQWRQDATLNVQQQSSTQVLQPQSSVLSVSEPAVIASLPHDGGEVRAVRGNQSIAGNQQNDAGSRSAAHVNVVPEQRRQIFESNLPNPSSSSTPQAASETPPRSPVSGKSDAALQTSQQPEGENSAPTRPQSSTSPTAERLLNLQQNLQAAKAESPAIARAQHVDDAVRIENAVRTGGLEDSAARPITPAPIAGQPAAAGPQSLNPGLLGHAQQLPLSGAVSHDTENLPSVVRSLAAMVNQRGGVMNMRLDPPELGQVRVQMTIVRAHVTAEFHAATQQAQALLERSLGALRLALESQGLSVDRLSVHHAPAASASAQHSSSGGRDESAMHQQQSHQHDRSQHDASQGESRGRERHDQSAAAANRSRWQDIDFESLITDLSGHESAQSRAFAASSVAPNESTRGIRSAFA